MTQVQLAISWFRHGCQLCCKHNDHLTTKLEYPPISLKGKAYVRDSKVIVLPSHHIELEVRVPLPLPPTHHNGPSMDCLPPSMDGFLLYRRFPRSLNTQTVSSLNTQMVSSLLTDGQFSPSMNWVFSLSMEGLLPLDKWPPPFLDAGPPPSLDEQLPPSLNAWPPPSTNVSQQMPLPNGLLPLDGWSPSLNRWSPPSLWTVSSLP
ncbi:uncharacterized protein LACBIDRAFT_332682 [Laccaria bicolor S238N-H82]|uniref:Predicted protein n=1 Tax=Laccaria bicolor (strain S238N-H82 / ATCC MYA-4686) TaxID=486041 RepID=B0DTI8_LACBS|nr:uncharacterized protein LACBIDRAFT_332682 [Laccaria bicolor S238N-H82]EDR02120.1 predicted protein [Laccaria bicolor S238N-H82]|eukprot:XP_001887277.1 predicted protein [Laccaria bicolor S238N-H82]